MRQYKRLLQTFLMKRVRTFRAEKCLSQEAMSECLRISPRSYIDLEHGKYGFSALSLIFFLLTMTEQEALLLLNDFRILIEDTDHYDAA